MSKINISVDTQTNELSLTVDGVKFENVTDINVCKYTYQNYTGDEMNDVVFHARLKTEELSDGLVKMVHLATAAAKYAKENGQPSESLGDVLIYKGTSISELTEAAQALFRRQL